MEVNLLKERIGKRIRGVRRSRRVEDVDLAAYAKISVRTLWSYENGHTLPSIPRLIWLSKKLRVSTDYLLCLTEDPNRK